jgi:hypothetical protein
MKDNKLEDFKKYLPIDDERYQKLISTEGLNGYYIRVSMNGEPVLTFGDSCIKTLEGHTKEEIKKEMNK